MEVTNDEANIGDSSSEEDDSSSEEDEEEDDEDEDDEEDNFGQVLLLKELFNKTRESAFELNNKAEPNLEDGLHLWEEIKSDFNPELYLSDEFKYVWETDWIEKSFNPNDLTKDFTWPNGVDKEPRGIANPVHFYNQLKRIPLKYKDAPPLRILQIALNLGQAESSRTH